MVAPLASMSGVYDGEKGSVTSTGSLRKLPRNPWKVAKFWFSFGVKNLEVFQLQGGFDHSYSSPSLYFSSSFYSIPDVYFSISILFQFRDIFSVPVSIIFLIMFCSTSVSLSIYFSVPILVCINQSSFICISVVSLSTTTRIDYLMFK